MTSVVLPPDSEIVVPFSVRSPSGVRLGSCSLVEPSRSLAEEYGVVVGHTLVDASSWLASVLMVNPNAEEIVLPSFYMCGRLNSSVGCFGGYGGTGPAKRYVRSLAGPSEGHCHGISPFVGRGWSTVAAGAPPSV